MKPKYTIDPFDLMVYENAQLMEENAKLRELIIRMRPICMEGKRCTFADRIYIDSTMEELRI